MIIDNSELIRNLLEFPVNSKDHNTEYFYVVQLIQRQKDHPVKFWNPNMRSNSNRSLDTAYIYSREDYDMKLPLLLELAKVLQARIYINLNLKSSYKAFVNLVKNIGCRLETSNFTKLSRIYNEAVGECKGSVEFPDKWIIDIDREHLDRIDGLNEKVIRIRNKLTTLKGGYVGAVKVYAILPTPNGVHMITSSFDLTAFRKWESETFNSQLDIHKDNPTILWANSDWRNNNET